MLLCDLCPYCLMHVGGKYKRWFGVLYTDSQGQEEAHRDVHYVDWT